MVFVDASALVKRYVREHSMTVRRLVAAGPVAVSRLSEVEVPSALVRLVRDRARRTLLQRHVLRAGDAIQLASAIWLRQTVVLSGLLAFDTRLVAAAIAEQFTMPLPSGPGRSRAGRPGH